MSFINNTHILIHKILNLKAIFKGLHKSQVLDKFCAPRGIRTPNNSSEDCRDIHFTMGALKPLILYIILNLFTNKPYFSILKMDCNLVIKII